jgi:hypothetical protein
MPEEEVAAWSQMPTPMWWWMPIELSVEPLKRLNGWVPHSVSSQQRRGAGMRLSEGGLALND